MAAGLAPCGRGRAGRRCGAQARVRRRHRRHRATACGLGHDQADRPPRRKQRREAQPPASPEPGLQPDRLQARAQPHRRLRAQPQRRRQAAGQPPALRPAHRRGPAPLVGERPEDPGRHARGDRAGREQLPEQHRRQAARIGLAQVQAQGRLQPGQLVARTMMTGRPLVLVSWDGASEALAMIHLDASAQFDWLLFDFSGRQAPGPRELRGLTVQVLSAATECKGEIYQALAAHLAQQDLTPEFVSLIDDDILIAVSDINRSLHLGRSLGLDVFSPTLSHDSIYTHRWSLSQPSRLIREVDWIEVMMPFYRGTLFMAGSPHYRGNVSSWGIDKYLPCTLR
eukprot:Opistho-2@65353